MRSRPFFNLGHFRRQAFNLNFGSMPAGLRQVIIHLYPQPGIRRAAEGLFKTDRHFRRHTAAPRHDIMQLLPR